MNLFIKKRFFNRSAKVDPTYGENPTFTLSRLRLGLRVRLRFLCNFTY